MFGNLVEARKLKVMIGLRLGTGKPHNELAKESSGVAGLAITKLPIEKLLVRNP